MPDHDRRTARHSHAPPASTARQERGTQQPVLPSTPADSPALAHSDSSASAHASPLRLGEYLCMLGLITETQLEHALVMQRRVLGPPMPLGTLLVDQGLLTSQDLVMALMLQQLDRLLGGTVPTTARLGELLVQAGVISAAQCASALHSQLQRRRPGEHVRLGQVLINLGFVTPRRLATALREQAAARDGARRLRNPDAV